MVRDLSSGAGLPTGGSDLLIGPAHAGSAAVHQLLGHLHDAVPGSAPRPFWVRDGREAVTFLDGEAVTYPIPEWLRSNEPVAEAGRLLRRLHDASEVFLLNISRDGVDELTWQCGTVRHEPGQVVLHGDVGPANIVWHDGVPVALIDWEFAEPGDAMGDLVGAAVSLCGFAPIDRAERSGFGGLDPNERLDALASGYGLVTAAEIRERIGPMLEAKIAQIIARAEAGVPRWQALVAAGVPERLQGLADHANR